MLNYNRRHEHPNFLINFAFISIEELISVFNPLTYTLYYFNLTNIFVPLLSSLVNA